MDPLEDVLSLIGATSHLSASMSAGGAWAVRFAPPAGVKSPSLWGTEARLREMFPQAEIAAKTRQFAFRYRSAAHWVQVFRDFVVSKAQRWPS